MPFVFTNLFYVLLFLGLVPLSMAWAGREFFAIAIAYDVALFALAIVDYRMTAGRATLEIARAADERFALGDDNEVTVTATNVGRRRAVVRVKDEYPSQLRITGSREATLDLEPGDEQQFGYALYPTQRGAYRFGKLVGRIRGR